MKELNKYILNKIKADKVSWTEISRDYKLSEEFIRQYQDKVKWSLIVKHQELTKEFLIEFKDKIKLVWIPSHHLNENVFKEFKDQINWRDSAVYQYISEEFVSENKDKVDWRYLSYYYTFSEKFFIDNNENITIPYLLYKQKTVNAYSKQTQKLILSNLIESNLIDNDMAHLFKDRFTPYMQEQYSKLSIML